MILDRIRDQVGWDNYNRLVREYGEDGLIAQLVARNGSEGTGEERARKAAEKASRVAEKVGSAIAKCFDLCITYVYWWSICCFPFNLILFYGPWFIKIFVGIAGIILSIKMLNNKIKLYYQDTYLDALTYFIALLLYILFFFVLPPVLIIWGLCQAFQ